MNFGSEVEKVEEAGLLDLYLSTVSFRKNEVMKVLTVIATIFIPITCLTGIYGMNFKYMSELAWHWGYAAAWALMAARPWAWCIFSSAKSGSSPEGRIL